MNPYFLSHGSSAEDIKNVLSRAIQIGIDFKCGAKVKGTPDQMPTTKSFSDMPSNGISLDQLLNEFRDIASASANWSSPNFMGWK
ncbi:hypothetical protein ACKAV7_014063 [Fusarium commune]|nr:hypothetical protein LZL87_013508 [Fusarium oxysporum]